MNNDAENDLAKFEAFLADTDNQTKEETLGELADQGVKTAEFFTQIQMVVREGYSKRLKEIAEFDSKTPAMRLRSVLFVAWTQAGKLGEFDDYYRNRIETYIIEVKNTLKPV